MIPKDYIRLAGVNSPTGPVSMRSTEVGAQYAGPQAGEGFR